MRGGRDDRFDDRQPQYDSYDEPPSRGGRADLFDDRQPPSRDPQYDAYDEPPSRPQTQGGYPQQQMQRRSGRSFERSAAVHERTQPNAVDFRTLVLDEFRKLILHRGGAGGIVTLGRTFRIMDGDHNMRIDAEELDIALRRFGMAMKPKDCKLLLAAIDKDGSGTVNYDEFLTAVRGKINRRRMEMIKMAFKIMDSTGDGVITIADLGKYNVKFDPDVTSGKISPDEAFATFLGNFEGVEHDGVVTWNEWVEYYRSVSASVDNDDYFELMMRNAWHITGGDGWCANTSNLRILVEFVDGEQKIVEIEDDMGLDKNNHDAVMRALSAQGVSHVNNFWLYE